MTQATVTVSIFNAMASHCDRHGFTSIPFSLPQPGKEFQVGPAFYRMMYGYSHIRAVDPARKRYAANDELPQGA